MQAEHVDTPEYKLIHFNIHLTVIHFSLGTNEYTESQIQIA